MSQGLHIRELEFDREGETWTAKYSSSRMSRGSELYAKTMALIRRSRGDLLTHDRLSAAGITLELSTRRVFAGRREVSLTPKEFALLSSLMRNRNMVMSREQLLVKCWGYDYEGESRAVDTQIRRLRDKLGEYSACIKTVIKAGYKLEG